MSQISTNYRITRQRRKCRGRQSEGLLTPGDGLAANTETAVAKSPSSLQSEASPEEDLMGIKTKEQHVETEKQERLSTITFKLWFCFKRRSSELGLGGKIKPKRLSDEGNAAH